MPRSTVSMRMAAISLLLAPLWSLAEPADRPAAVEKVGEHTWLYTGGGERSLFVVGRDAVIVTDPLGRETAPAYLAAIRELTDLPVRWVVYSHNHRDRIGGAETFARDGAEVVAQERCAEFLRLNPHPDITMPDRLFTDRLSLDAGGASLELRWFGPAHGDCLTVFHALPAGLVQVVDLLPEARAAFPEDPLVPNLRPHNLRAFFAATADYAEESGATGVVASTTRAAGCNPSGDCEAPATGPVSAITGQATFWNLAFDTVKAAHERHAIGNDSMPRLREEDLAPFRNFPGYDQDALMYILRRLVSYEAMGR